MTGNPSQLRLGYETIPRLSHRADPPSSKRAAKLHHESLRAAHAQIVLNAVTRWPGRTAMELVALIEGMSYRLDEYQVRRRLTDLKLAGLIRREPMRRCRVKGSMMATWRRLG